MPTVPKLPTILPDPTIPNPHPDLSFLELANNALSGSVPTDFCLAYYADLDLSGNPGLTPVDCPPDLVTGQDAEGDAGKELPKDEARTIEQQQQQQQRDTSPWPAPPVSTTTHASNCDPHRMNNATGCLFVCQPEDNEAATEHATQPIRRAISPNCIPKYPSGMPNRSCHITHIKTAQILLLL